MDSGSARAFHATSAQSIAKLRRSSLRRLGVIFGLVGRRAVPFRVRVLLRAFLRPLLRSRLLLVARLRGAVLVSRHSVLRLRLAFFLKAVDEIAILLHAPGCSLSP